MGRACWEDAAGQVSCPSLRTHAGWEQRTHHTEDGIDHEVDGHVRGRSPVPHGPGALLVVGQEVAGQAAQGGLGGLGHPAPGLGSCSAEGEGRERGTLLALGQRLPSPWGAPGTAGRCQLPALTHQLGFLIRVK